MKKKKLLFLMIFLFIIAFLYIIPSLLYLINTGKEEKGNTIQNILYLKHKKWIPKNHINLGLDLQGGISILLESNIENAISKKYKKLKKHIQSFMKLERIEFTSVKYKKNKYNRIEIILFDKKEIFLSKIKHHFNQNILIKKKKGNKIEFILSNLYLDKYKEFILSTTINIIKDRVDKLGIVEGSIARYGKSKIQIQLPGYNDPEKAKRIIGRTAILAFYICDENNEFLLNIDKFEGIDVINNSYIHDIYLLFNQDKKKLVDRLLKGRVPQKLLIKYGYIQTLEENKIRTYTLKNKIELTGKYIVDAKMEYQIDRGTTISVSFNLIGAKILDKITKQYIGKRLAIVIEDEVYSAPIIKSHIKNGEASISMQSKDRVKIDNDAKELVLVLKSGALPSSIDFKEERNIGATLGSKSINSAMKASIVGISILILFMILFYRVSGIISIIGLFYNFLFIFAILSKLEATLTLPSIGGLLLTMGMAVDANIIINERVKEEMRSGLSFKKALNLGYNKALVTILDANITTFISGLILYYFGTGSIQNFAIMLIIGTVTSVISAVYITKIFFNIIMNFYLFKKKD